VAALAGGFAAPASALTGSFSFTGAFAGDDDVALIFFTLDEPSTVTAITYSYAGGTQADGNAVPAGGFDPMLTLFSEAGLKLADNDDGIGAPFDPNTGDAFDAELSVVLAAGAYVLALTQYDNFSLGDLADGFAESGNPFFTALYGCSNGQFCDESGNPPFDNRTSAWALDLLNVTTAVPEPGVVAALGLGLGGLGAWERRRRT
jgi:hypothetical protein